MHQDALSVLLVLSGAIAIVVMALRRTVTSPLRDVPGPLLFKLSRYPLWIQDFRSTSHSTVRKLHNQYGKIVRIGPSEISINDVELFHKTIYKQGSPFMKEPDLYASFELPGAASGENVFTTTDTNLHSQLRRLQASGYSRKSILGIESMLWDRVKKMSDVVDCDYASKSAPLNIANMFRSLTLDAISLLLFGASMGALEKPGFCEEVLDVFNYFEIFTVTFYRNKWLQGLILPVLARLPFDTFKVIDRMLERASQHLEKIDLDDPGAAGLLKSMSESQKGLDLPFPIDKDYVRMLGAGGIFAGTDTTGAALAIGSWAIFSNETVRCTLLAELKTVWSGQEDPHPALAVLESLPYLQACVKESLRVATSICGRLTRVVPQGGFVYGGHSIPAGTAISSSAWLMHHDEDVFPNPFEFDPGRWLTKDAEVLRLRNFHLVPYGHGSRKCLGINLAQAELYMAIASVFRFFRPVEILTKEPEAERKFGTALPRGVWVKVAHVED